MKRCCIFFVVNQMQRQMYVSGTAPCLRSVPCAQCIIMRVQMHRSLSQWPTDHSSTFFVQNKWLNFILIWCKIESFILRQMEYNIHTVSTCGLRWRLSDAMSFSWRSDACMAGDVLHYTGSRSEYGLGAPTATEYVPKYWPRAYSMHECIPTMLAYYSIPQENKIIISNKITLHCVCMHIFGDI